MPYRAWLPAAMELKSPRGSKIPKLEALRKEKIFGKEEKSNKASDREEDSKGLNKANDKEDEAIYDENDFEADEEERMYNTDSAFEDSVSLFIGNA